MKKRPNHATRKRKRKPAHDPRLHTSRLASMSIPQAVCVTICTPKYAHLRAAAVESFRQFLGLPVMVLEVADEEGYETKMKLDLLCGERQIVFCDIDWRPIRPIPTVWESGQWCAVRDHGHKHPASFASHDIEAHKLDPMRYFNSGFFTCNLRNASHAAAFVTARAIWQDVREKKRPRVGDFGDQFYLNAGVQSMGIPVNLLPVGFNWIRGYAEHGMFPYVPRTIYGVHAAGVPVDHKAEHLYHMTQAHAYDCAPMCAGVAEEFLAMGVELL